MDMEYLKDPLQPDCFWEYAKGATSIVVQFIWPADRCITHFRGFGPEPLSFMA